MDGPILAIAKITAAFVLCLALFYLLLVMGRDTWSEYKAGKEHSYIAWGAFGTFLVALLFSIAYASTLTYIFRLACSCHD